MSLFFAMRNLSFYALILLINFFYYRHSVLLFLDFLDVFRYLIIILTQKVSFFLITLLMSCKNELTIYLQLGTEQKEKERLAIKTIKCFGMDFYVRIQRMSIICYQKTRLLRSIVLNIFIPL